MPTFEYLDIFLISDNGNITRRVIKAIINLRSPRTARVSTPSTWYTNDTTLLITLAMIILIVTRSKREVKMLLICAPHLLKIEQENVFNDVAIM
jgi:hypothetical protein